MSEPRTYSHPRSLFGPLVLTALGVLLLLHTTGKISHQTLLVGFARYWPLILILWGAIKLVEHSWARKSGYAARGIGAGSVVFLIFFIMCGLAASAVLKWGAYFDIDDNWEDSSFFGTQHEFTENLSQPIQAGAAVKVVGGRAYIKITASPDNQVHLFVHKYVRTESQNEATQLNDSTHPKFEQQGDTLVLEMVSGDFERGRFDLDLQVPRSSPVFVTTRRGDIHVFQRDKDVELESRHGNLSVEQVKGNTTLRLRNSAITVWEGDVTVRNVSGNVSVDGAINHSTVSDIGGTVTFTGSYAGDVRLSNIAGQLNFKSAQTGLRLAKLDGTLTMDRGDFRGNSITGPLWIDTHAKNINLKDVGGEINIQDTRGSIEVHTTASLGIVDITNRAGEINFNVPERANFQVEAESDNGRIMSDFQLNVNNEHQNATASGIVGKGGPQIHLTAKQGTIQIRKEPAR